MFKTDKTYTTGERYVFIVLHTTFGSSWFSECNDDDLSLLYRTHFMYEDPNEFTSK